MNLLTPTPENLYEGQFSSIQDAITQSGLKAPAHIPAGKFIRFPGMEKPPSNEAAWAILFSDRMAGMFGDFSTGLSHFWKAAAITPLTELQRQKRAQERELTQRALNQERQRIHQTASIKAESLWENANKASPEHPYLARKMIQAHSIRSHRDSLVIPVFQTNASISSLQFINQLGEKRFLKGGRLKGGFYPLADLTMTDQLVIAEGFATAATILEHSGIPTICAFNAGNLTSVAITLRKKYPTKDIVIAGDDDRSTPNNPGKTAANNAALVCGGKVVFPQWPDDTPETLTDFNDLYVWKKTLGVGV